jgi:hypothetical protein
MHLVAAALAVAPMGMLPNFVRRAGLPFLRSALERPTHPPPATAATVEREQPAPPAKPDVKPPLPRYRWIHPSSQDEEEGNMMDVNEN